MAREVTELVKDTEPPLLFHHSSRVYYWGALTGKRRGLKVEPELLYAGGSSCAGSARNGSPIMRPSQTGGRRFTSSLRAPVSSS